MGKKIIYFSPLIVFFLLSCSKNSDQGYTSGALPEQVDFNFHIKPILSDRCFKCHGPDEKVREANLRLDVKESAFALMDSAEQRYAIVPGDPENSSLFQRVFSKNPEVMMPPPESNLALSEREILLLKKWIEQGAEWKEHWAFIPPEKAALPLVKHTDWPANEIDQFVLAKMERMGLEPSPEASKEKLLRSLSFDLRGIAPSVAELDDFLRDDSPDAYEKWVDKFLESESYGERMAMEWLDVARYADSHGYQDDIERSMWPWRDWVIKAFNENMPYDQFVTWQLAGDLLPDPSYEQKLATGFNRNHKITQEVGVVDEEYRVEYVLDRVNTVSTSFMGLTVACAQCHDHKFDPISQKEFYGMFSFFNNVPERGRVEYNVEVAEPSLPLPEETVEKYQASIKNILDTQLEKVRAHEKKELEKAKQMTSLEPSAENSSQIPPGLRAYFSLDFMEDSLLYNEVNQKKTVKGLNLPVPSTGKYSGALTFNGKNYLDLGSFQEIDFRKPFTFSFWIKSINGGISGKMIAPRYASEKSVRGLYLGISSTKDFYFEMKSRSGKQKLSLRTREKIPADRWVHIALSSDGSLRTNGIQMYMDGKAMECISLTDEIRSPLAMHKGISLAGSENGGGIVSGQLDELMFFDRHLNPEEVKQVSLYNPLPDLKKKALEDQQAAKRLSFQYLHHKDQEYQTLTQRLIEYKIRESRMDAVILKPTMIMEDMDTIRPTFVLDRGSYDAPGERVYAGTPAHILPFPEEYPQNRLGFAKWLFHEKNPLTARVAVNRYWQLIFGRGIVATPEDFGSQGDLPSHPQLLDGLAIDFRESGWDIKSLLKKMLLSNTYRQSRNTNEHLQAIDPANIYLAHGPAVRLQAEMLRDHALAASGLLSPQIGGPSVKPYHPEGLWLETASGNQPLRKYIQDHDQDLYRKSMYTFWKRTVPPPSMITFDASSREECIVRRQSTSTPMQALVLLNDPQFIEASRLIAERMLREGGSDAKQRISFAFRLLTSRAPSEKEVMLLSDLLQKKQAGFEKEPKQAKEYLSIGEYPRTGEFDSIELAAYSQLAHAILNLTESIRKG